MAAGAGAPAAGIAGESCPPGAQPGHPRGLRAGFPWSGRRTSFGDAVGLHLPRLPGALAGAPLGGSECECAHGGERSGMRGWGGGARQLLKLIPLFVY